jgi:CRISPR associated protein Cas2
VRYVISYDLVKRKDYPELWAALQRWGARRVLLSQWAVRWNDTSAAAIREAVRLYIDSDDRVLVMCVDNGDWASFNALVDLNTI